MRRDRTRRFTVGFGPETRHVQIFAANPSTLHWCARNQQVMRVITNGISDRLQDAKLATSSAALPPALAVAETPATIASRFLDMLHKGFPDEAFEVTPLS